MSRCFPFPPPGYERKNRVSDEALIESIKREQHKAEKESRKEKKREKKEKKNKEKNEKSGLCGEIEKKSHSRRDRDSKLDYRVVENQKKKEIEIEHLERSGLSEEHGQPLNGPNLCDSSDSTQNSGKRKKHSSPLHGSHNQSTMLRIRLPLVKHRDPQCSSSVRTETTTPKMADIGPRLPLVKHTDPEWSSSVRTEIIVPKMAEIGPIRSIKVSSSSFGRRKFPAQDGSEPAVAAAIDPSPKQKQVNAISERIEPVAQDSSKTPATPMAGLGPSETSLLSNAQLRNIIEDWTPPQLQMEETVFDDQEWLFGMPSKREAKRAKVSDVGPSCKNTTSLWPKACWLPEVDIYALPYTVPF